jgi:hypothetical protein
MLDRQGCFTFDAEWPQKAVVMTLTDDDSTA